MQIGHILHYTLVYPGEDVPSLDDIVKQIPTQLGLEYFAFFNSVMHLNSNSEKSQRKCFNELYTPERKELMDKIMFLGSRQAQQHGIYYMFDPFTILTVINSLILNRNNVDVGAIGADASQKELMIKAILRANQKLNDDYLRKVDDEPDQLVRFCKLMWPNIVMTGGHRFRNDFLTAAYKSIKLLEYIKEQPEIFKEFIFYFEIKDDNDHLKFVERILSFYVNASNKDDDERLHHAYSSDVETEYPVVAKFCMHLQDFDLATFKAQDFRTLRTKPVIKIRSKRYIVTNWNFLLEKLYTGLVFELFENTQLKDQYNDRLDTFKGKIGYEFSEKFFTDTFQKIVVARKDVFIVEKREERINSDIYFRRHHKVALIEFKDTLLVKGLTYEKVKEEIDRKLNEESKGTGQLKKQLDKFALNLDVYEKTLSQRKRIHKLRFYPIIVVTETAFSIGGITQYLQKEFTKRIEGIKYPFIVMPLVVIDFDFFLSNYDEFTQIDFFNLLEFYLEENQKAHKLAKTKPHINNVMSQFNAFTEVAYKKMPKKLEQFGFIGNYVTRIMNISETMEGE